MKHIRLICLADQSCIPLGKVFAESLPGNVLLGSRVIGIWRNHCKGLEAEPEHYRSRLNMPFFQHCVGSFSLFLLLENNHKLLSKQDDFFVSKNILTRKLTTFWALCYTCLSKVIHMKNNRHFQRTVLLVFA